MITPYIHMGRMWKKMIRDGWTYLPTVGWYDRKGKRQILRCTDKKSGVLRRIKYDNLYNAYN